MRKQNPRGQRTNGVKHEKIITYINLLVRVVIQAKVRCESAWLVLPWKSNGDDRILLTHILFCFQ